MRPVEEATRPRASRDFSPYVREAGAQLTSPSTLACVALTPATDLEPSSSTRFATGVSRVATALRISGERELTLYVIDTVVDMADESPAPTRDLLSALLPTPRRNVVDCPLYADSDSDDDGASRSTPRGASPWMRGGLGNQGALTPSDRFLSAAMSSSQRRAFTGRSRELLLAKNAREASREKATLKQHCNALEEKIRALELRAEEEANEKVEALKTEVVRLKADLTDAKRAAYEVSRAAAAAAAECVSAEAHERVRMELEEARVALEAARVAKQTVAAEHEKAASELTEKLAKEHKDALQNLEAKAMENDEWLRSALEERTSAVAALERERQQLAARVTELESVVAEGEACLRDLDVEREAQCRKYKRATAAETAGRLAAEATAAALSGEVTRLHGVIERCGLKPPKPAVETVDCMTSPMPVTEIKATTNAAEEDNNEKIHINATNYEASGDWQMTEEGTAVIGHEAESDEVMGLPVTPAFSVKATARAFEAAVAKQSITPRAMNTSMEDSAMGGGMGSVGPASVESRPIAKSTAMASLATFPLEYTPLSKPSTALAEARTRSVLTPTFAGDCRSASEVFAGDVDLVATIVTLVQCLCVLALTASRRSKPVVSLGIKVLSAVLITALMAMGMLLAMEVALQLSGDPPTLAVPMRMGGVPPRQTLRRLATA